MRPPSHSPVLSSKRPLPEIVTGAGRKLQIDGPRRISGLAGLCPQADLRWSDAANDDPCLTGAPVHSALPVDAHQRAIGAIAG